MFTIKLPKTIRSNFEGFQYLTKICCDLHTEANNFIEVDFADVTWFDANLCAVLGACFSRLHEKLNQVHIINLNKSQLDIFSRNHFMAYFGSSIIPDYNETTIKYRKSKLTDEKLIRNYLSTELMGKNEFPKLSNAARKEIEFSIFEIFSNAVIHGNCDYIFSCGQYYPKKQPPSIDFTIVDLGNTIKQNVNDFSKTLKSGKEAIEWAIADGNTTKPKENNIPGGLGFKLICDFIELNKGKIQIVSADGYWQFEKEKVISKVLSNDFPGTIVNMEFNLLDDNYYSLKTETVDDIIF